MRPWVARALIFSQPYLENRLVLVGRHGADVAAKALPALAGRRIAIVEGYSYGDALERSGVILQRRAARKTAWRSSSRAASTTR